MVKRIEVQYQSWKHKYPRYRTFDYDKVKKSGNDAAITRYEDCLQKFEKMSAEEREQGVIFAGIEYDFCFKEVYEHG